MNKQKVLLIMPDFYSYTDKLIQILKELNFDVVCCYEEPKRITFLVLRKLNVIFGKNRVYHIWNGILWNKVKKSGKKYDLLILIRGNIIEKNLIEKIKCDLLSEQGEAVYYTWDSFEYLEHHGHIAMGFDRAYSFDSRDVLNNRQYQLLPLFYVKEFEDQNEKKEIRYDLCCIASFNMFRYRELMKIVKANPKLKVYIRLYIDKKLYDYKKTNEKEYTDIEENYLTFTSLDLEKVAEICKSSHAILDITDSKQTGLTMRTTESVGLRKKLVTNNRNISNYDFYSPENILLIGNEFGYKVNEEWFDNRYEIDNDIWESYSVNNWVRVLTAERKAMNHYVR